MNFVIDLGSFTFLYFIGSSHDYRSPTPLLPILRRVTMKEYIRSSNLSRVYFRSSHDKCYCPEDYPDTRLKRKKQG